MTWLDVVRVLWPIIATIVGGSAALIIAGWRWATRVERAIEKVGGDIQRNRTIALHHVHDSAGQVVVPREAIR